MSRKKSDTNVLHSERTAAYSQFLTLPGPVDSGQMNVERKEDMVVVTLPKRRRKLPKLRNGRGAGSSVTANVKSVYGCPVRKLGHMRCLLVIGVR